MFPFDTTLLALLIETIKLGVSLVLLAHELGDPVQCMNKASLLVQWGWILCGIHNRVNVFVPCVVACIALLDTNSEHE